MDFQSGALEAYDASSPFTANETLAARRSQVSVRAQVHSALRAALISGRMKPNVVYSAPALAGMLGVSATPVREAMLDLVTEGLVVAVRNKGFRVTEVTERELDELIEARLLLEVPIMGAVAAAYAPSMDARLEHLRELATEMDDLARSGDMVRYLQLDTEFHAGFLGLHGNAEIVEVVARLRGRSRLFGLEALARAGHLLTSTREHGRMIDLAVAGDRSGLEELTRVHLSHARTIWAAPQHP